jgi:hypothetical protein
MALYGSLSHVQSMLRPNESTAYGADISDRLALIQAAISAQIEADLGRTFGETATDTTELVWAGASDVLLLPRPARSITSVTVGGSVSGGTMTGGTAYASNLWTFSPFDADDETIYGLRLLSGGWWGTTTLYGTPTTPVAIVGDFSDTDSDATVPDDITYAANLLILRTLQRESTGVAGVSGEDGTFQPPLDPWKDPTVRRILDQYRIASRGWAV